MFIVINYVFCVLVAVCCIMPVIHILAVSLSSKNAVFSGHVAFWPIGLNVDSYRIVVRDQQFFVSYLVSIQRAALGWLIQMALTILAAYPLYLKRNMFPAQPFFI